ncbi:hypothetical protein ONZ43_g5515 [Nemania bipapillata]|uniref:Uncharacterized protein n=1 Tax=Nemania bipapillata TaxID=110536 RepID=A0ACC2I9R5_9PEZI|nr:hypothetical protein ONZ43_g5515 [Nemania bipapillata]
MAAREECEYGFHNEDAERRPDREPLHDRGWTLQEAILSTRVVFYTPNELQWQCQAVHTCECQIPPPTKPGVIASRAHMQRGLGEPKQLSEIFAAWDRIVEAYTERLLTNPDDKLPALSGLAQLAHKSISIAPRDDGHGSVNETSLSRQHGYVAGLWVDNLVRGMLWGPLWMTVQLPSNPFQTTAAPGITTEEGSDYYRAPTFSWASVDGPVTYRSRNSHLSLDDTAYIETARVIDSWSQSSGVDPYGRLAAVGNPQVRSGCRTGVVLQAPVIENCALIHNSSRSMHNSPWTLREIEPQSDTLWLDTKFVEPFPIADDSSSREKQDNTEGGNCVCQGEHKGGTARWSVRRSRNGSGRTVEKGDVMGGVSLIMMAQSTRVQYFLLLGVSPSDPTAYERLGTVSTSRAKQQI